MQLEAYRVTFGLYNNLNRTNDDANVGTSETAKELSLDDTSVVGKNEDSSKSYLNPDGKTTLPWEKTTSAENKNDNLKTDRQKAEEEHSKNKHDGFQKDCPLCQCETCRNRRYQDGSDDSAVSFQAPTKMSPTKASTMVKSHEMEHVRREQFKAKEEDKQIVSQSVQIKTARCPECGKTYVSGGLTRTTTRPDLTDFRTLFSVNADEQLQKGTEVDFIA